MTGDLLRLAARLEDERRPFALATVVRSERPTSGKPGNTALITGGGTLHGWIGGSCTRSEVIRHALESLRLGEPRLLAFGTDEGRPGDLVQASMSCASGGKVEVHINPVLPAPVLLVAGDSPVARALLRLGRAMGYTTVATAFGNEEAARLADERVEELATAARTYGERPAGTRFFAVVATMGRDDERALARLTVAQPDYLGLVASPRRMRSVRAALADLGLDGEAVGRIRGPAGLDLGARQPEEIAVSILAEIVARARADDTSGDPAKAAATGADPGDRGGTADAGDPGGPGDGTTPAPTAPTASTTPTAPAPTAPTTPATQTDATPAAAWATDPVCGMTVPVAGSPSAVHDGRTLHFCCEGCRGLFEATPEVFAASPATGPA